MVQIVQQYQKMVAQKAWQCWYRLPPQTRAWVSVEDLIQDGLTHLHYKIRKKFDPTKASLSTFVWTCIEHFYKGYSDYHFMKKRFDGRTVPIREILGADIPPDFDSECSAVENLLRVYARSSPLLRLYLEQWFVRARVGKKLTRGTRFDTMRNEFLAIAGLVGLSRDECHYLLYSETWQKRLPRDWRYVADLESCKIEVDDIQCHKHQQNPPLSSYVSSVGGSSLQSKSVRLSSSPLREFVVSVTEKGSKSLTGNGALEKKRSLATLPRSTGTTQIRVPLAGRNVRTAKSARSL